MTTKVTPVPSWEIVVRIIAHLLTCGLQLQLSWGQSYRPRELFSKSRHLAGKRAPSLDFWATHACRTTNACYESSSIHIKKVRSVQINSFRERSILVPKSEKSTIFRAKTKMVETEPFRGQICSPAAINTPGAPSDTLF